MASRSIATCPLLDRYRAVRRFTRKICEPLQTEDYVVQSMPDVSPTRWHLAHTTWFFETFLLKPFSDGYRSPNEAFEFLFNSYYNAVGKQYPRAKRGVLTRPSVQQVWDYRTVVDEAIELLLAADRLTSNADFLRILEIGLHHEQQHQELMLTDIKHVLSCNPLFPVYQTKPTEASSQLDVAWREYSAGNYQFGHKGDGFHFDNEVPHFEQLVQDYSMQDRLVTNREFLAFVQARGYERPEHWLSMGWGTIEQEGWSAPLYWFDLDGEWYEFTLHGLNKLELDLPVTHVSYFEADAFARWAGVRLPTEFEWERAAMGMPLVGNFADTQRFHPRFAEADADADASLLRQMFGDVWEWTSSQYSAYPGYRPPEGALGEYNGKFMCNQFVLRGGSCATSRSHIRPTYRNFFPPNARWQFTGIRLAQ